MKKPKTARRARFTGALAQPIVRPDEKGIYLAAALANKNPAPQIALLRSKVEDEINFKVALLAKHYNIDTSATDGGILPRLALALCFDFVDGFQIIDQSESRKKGRPAKDWSGLYAFVKVHQASGGTVIDACREYRETLTGTRKPSAETLKNAFFKYELAERNKSAQATQQLIEALMVARKRNPDWMTRLRDSGSNPI